MEVSNHIVWSDSFSLCSFSFFSVRLQVMGLMLGNFVDDYTVNCIDVFAMPQSGTSVTVEAVDPVFQHKMLEMLKQTGRPEMVVGWYVRGRESVCVCL